jgi:phytoene desaturase
MQQGELAGLDAVVIGGGFGGLSTACYLADAGADVTVLERNEQMGGRASRLDLGEYSFDMGPSWYLMPDVFERFFGHFDREPSEYYELEHLDPHYRIFFKDGDEVTMPKNLEDAKAIFDEYEEDGGAKLDRYLEQSRFNYEVGMEHFVYEDRERLRDFVDLDVVRNARGLTLLGNMERYVRKRFESPKLRKILQYTLVFLGGSPKNTPALYNLISHVDFNLGVWYPEGGMTNVADQVAAMAEDLGATMETGVDVTSIDGSGGAAGDGLAVTAHDGGSYGADVVVSDADYAHTELELLDDGQRSYDESYWDKKTYAPSAFLLYLGVEGEVPELAHHTLVLPTDWDHHFDAIFDEPRWPEDPAYYVCAASQNDPELAPEGDSALFVLVPIAPGLEDTEAIRDEQRDRVLDDMAEHADTDIRDRIVEEERFCVDDFVDRYNSREGTALGLAHTLFQTSFLRPSHRSDAVDGLYYTGSFTTPGIGVPMCLISGEHTADKVKHDLGN